jgi:hypothetical protein
MKPDFKTMQISDLRAYVLQHRDDDEAFYTLMDRSNKHASLSYPCPDTPENLQMMKQAIREKLSDRYHPR